MESYMNLYKVKLKITTWNEYDGTRHDYVWITVKGEKWYLHGLPYDVEVMEFEPREKEIEVTGIKKPKSVKLLKTGQDLDYEYDNDTLIVIIPVSACSRYVDVVVVE